MRPLLSLALRSSLVWAPAAAAGVFFLSLAAAS